MAYNTIYKRAGTVVGGADYASSSGRHLHLHPGGAWTLLPRAFDPEADVDGSTFGPNSVAYISYAASGAVPVGPKTWRVLGASTWHQTWRTAEVTVSVLDAAAAAAREVELAAAAVELAARLAVCRSDLPTESPFF